MSPKPSAIRVAIVIAGRLGGVILLALGLGAVAGQFGGSDRVVLTATLVTIAFAFVGGMLAEPVLRRWATRPRAGVGQVESERPPVQRS